MHRVFPFVSIAATAFALQACTLDPIGPDPSAGSSSSSSSSGAGGIIGACGSVNCPKPPPSTISVELRQTLDEGSRKMAISGDTLVALCSSVRVFDRVSGSFAQSHVIYPQAGSAEWESVAIHGDTIVLGAPQANGGRGLVQVFVRQNGSWADNGIEVAPAEPLDGENFGASVAIHGDVLVVGAPTAAGSSAPESVYVFRHDGQTFVQTENIIVPSGDYDTSFGSSVAFGGNYGIIGAPDQGVTGAAYILRQNGDWWYTNEQSWYAPDSPVLGIGLAVAASDDGRTLAAGSLGASKRAVMLTRIAQDGNQQYGYLDAPEDATTDAAFGISVAAGSDFVAVGSSRWANSSPDSGVVHAYGYSGQTSSYQLTQWEEPVVVTSPAKSSTDGFGSVLVASENTLVVGAPAGLGECQAKTYVYEVVR